jgi:hypothetical protein
VLRVGAVDVIGHSDGGDVALRLARTHPELVRRVVISGANLRPSLSKDELQVRQHWSDRELAEFLSRFEQRLPPTFRREYQAVTPDGAAHWSTVLAKSYRLWLTPVVMDSADLAAIQAPVLVIAGDRDFSSIVKPQSSIEDFAKRSSSSFPAQDTERSRIGPSLSISQFVSFSTRRDCGKVRSARATSRVRFALLGGGAATWGSQRFRNIRNLRQRRRRMPVAWVARLFRASFRIMRCP